MSEAELKGLQTLPIDQLEQLVLDRASEASANLSGYDNFAQSMGLEETLPSAGTLGGPDASEVRAASEKLVQAGLMKRPTDRVTTDMRRALQAAADRRDPGLYDVMADDKDLVEVLGGVANGSFDVGASPAVAAE